jgi:hypothetical protein
MNFYDIELGQAIYSWQPIAVLLQLLAGIFIPVKDLF